MEELWKWGAGIILEIQSWGWPLLPFELVTMLGDEGFYFILVPLFYWCIDKRYGVLLLGMLLTSSFINSVLKIAFTEPRPYWVNSQITGHVIEKSYGIPSGHTQNAITIWGYQAHLAGKGGRNFWPYAILLMILISFSRMILGVHFPQDLITGAVAGIVLLVLYILFSERIVESYMNQPVSLMIASSLGLSVFVILSGFFMIWLVSGRADPENWAILAAIPAGLETYIYEPRDPAVFISIAGTIAGGGIGLALSKKAGSFVIPHPFQYRMYMLFSGLAGVAVIRFGLGALFPSDGMFEYPLRYIRYIAILIFAIYIAPELFKKAGWCVAETGSDSKPQKQQEGNSSGKTGE